MAASIKNRATRNYKFWIYDSNLYNNALHPVTGISTPGMHTALADITKQSRDKQITLALNKSGQVSFRLPITSDAALQVVGYEVMRALVVYVDDVNGNPTPIWSGPIWTIDMTTDGGSVAVTAVGWLEVLNDRELRRPINFTNIDAGVIASRLLATANNQNSNQNVVTGTDATSNASQRTGINIGGTSAEDLFFGAGDFELDSDFSPNAVGSLDSIQRTSAANSVFSGNSSILLQSTNRNAVGYAKITPPNPYTTTMADGSAAVPVDPSSNYQLRSLVQISLLTGTAYCQGFITWYTAAGASISTTILYPFSGANPVGGNQAIYWNTAAGPFDSTAVFASPSNAAYAVVGLGAYTGTTGRIFVFHDGAVLSKNAVNTVPTPIFIGNVASPANPVGATRTRSYAVGQKIGLALEELSSIEAGFDYEVATVPTTVSGGATLLRNLNIYYGNVKGTINGVGQDRPNTIFGHRWGPNNVLSVRQTNDSSKLANRINARASGMLSMAQDPTSIALRGLMEDSINVSDTGVTPATLLGYAGAEVVYRTVPFKLYTVTPFPWDGDPAGRIPRFGIDYIVGDVCYLVANNGAMQIGISTGAPQPIRIFGLTISIDMEGNERISGLQTTYS